MHSSNLFAIFVAASAVIAAPIRRDATTPSLIAAAPSAEAAKAKPLTNEDVTQLAASIKAFSDIVYAEGHTDATNPTEVAALKAQIEALPKAQQVVINTMLQSSAALADVFAKFSDKDQHKIEAFVLKNLTPAQEAFLTLSLTNVLDDSNLDEVAKTIKLTKSEMSTFKKLNAGRRMQLIQYTLAEGMSPEQVKFVTDIFATYHSSSGGKTTSTEGKTVATASTTGSEEATDADADAVGDDTVDTVPASFAVPAPAAAATTSAAADEAFAKSYLDCLTAEEGAALVKELEGKGVSAADIASLKQQVPSMVAQAAGTTFTPASTCPTPVPASVKQIKVAAAEEKKVATTEEKVPATEEKAAPIVAAVSTQKTTTEVPTTAASSAVAEPSDAEVTAAVACLTAEQAKALIAALKAKGVSAEDAAAAEADLPALAAEKAGKTYTLPSECPATKKSLNDLD